MQPSNLMEGLLEGAALIVRHLPASGTCFISLTRLATASSYFVLLLSHTLQRKWRAVGLQPGQERLNRLQGAFLQLQHLPHASIILTCCRCPELLLPGKGALLSGQRQNGKEEKTLKRTREADSRSPRWWHSLPFSAKSPG